MKTLFMKSVLNFAVASLLLSSVSQSKTVGGSNGAGTGKITENITLTCSDPSNQIAYQNSTIRWLIPQSEVTLNSTEEWTFQGYFLAHVETYSDGSQKSSGVQVTATFDNSSKVLVSGSKLVPVCSELTKGTRTYSAELAFTAFFEPPFNATVKMTCIETVL